MPLFSTFELQLCVFVSPRNVFIYQTNTAFRVTLEGDLFSYVTSICAISHKPCAMSVLMKHLEMSDKFYQRRDSSRSTLLYNQWALFETSNVFKYKANSRFSQKVKSVLKSKMFLESWFVFKISATNRSVLLLYLHINISYCCLAVV